MRRHALRQFALVGLTGLLYPLCFPDYDLGFLTWFLLVPLHLAIADTAPRRAFGLGWLAGSVGFAGTMFWVVTAMHLYGKMPLIWSYVALGLLAAYLGLYLGVYAAAVVWLRRTLPPVAWIAAPFIWVALELIRTYLFSGLPWALLGYTQYQWLGVIQIADATGVYGVSFLLVLTNAALADLILWRARRTRWVPHGQELRPFPWATTAAGIAALTITLAYGQMRLQSASAIPASSLSVGLVQANIDQGQKWDAAYRRETLDRYARLTAQAAEGVDLVIWPEAATPFLFEQERLYRAEIEALVRRYETPLLFGSPALRYYADGRPYLLNSAYLYSPTGDILGRYDKRHLVPFGEYIPLKSLLFFLDKLVEGIGDFESGTVPTVLSLPSDTQQPSGRYSLGPRFGVVICFEVIFPDLVRDFTRDGADFMVTITNDAWFGNSAAPYQHFGMVVFRAVENHVAFARAANTGISGFIDPYGRILSASPIFTERAIIGRIPAANTWTFYTRHGDVFAYGCAIITGLFFAAAVWRTSGGEPQPLVVGAT